MLGLVPAGRCLLMRVQFRAGLPPGDAQALGDQQ